MTPITFPELCERLQALCPHPLRVRMHQNCHAYVSVKRSGGRVIELAIHRLFLYASTPVLEALIQFATHRNAEAKATIRQMAHIYFTRIEPPVPDPACSDARGVYVDLQAIYDRLNKDFFQEKIHVPIAWVRAFRHRHVRKMTFGSFDRTIPLIRINRVLDRNDVPLPFVEYIVYHEMLHTVCEARVDIRGRLWVHTPEFHRREALHPHYLFAREWGKQNVNFLIGVQ